MIISGLWVKSTIFVVIQIKELPTRLVALAAKNHQRTILYHSIPIDTGIKLEKVK